MKIIWRLISWAFLALFLIEIVVVLIPKSNKGLHAREFGRLPVLLNGRIQPLDSVARNSLLQIRSTGDVPLEEVPSWKFWKHPEKLRATTWLLEVMLKPELADTRPIFLIHHPELLAELKLADKGVEKSALRYYTYNQIRDVDAHVREQGQKISEIKDEASRTPFQRQVLKLANAIVLYQRLKNSLQPQNSEDFARELADFQKAIPAGREAAQNSHEGKPFDKDALDRLMKPLQAFDFISQAALPLIIPPDDPARTRDDWHTMGNSLMNSARNGEVSPAATYYAKMATAYRADRTNDFNQSVAGYKEWLGQLFGTEVKKGRAEFYFNEAKFFLHAMIIYIVALVLAGVGLTSFAAAPNLAESLRRAAFYLIILAGIVHTTGLIFRMVLEGRPPVTNLYSSAVFIGWGAMVLGIILERAYRAGIGNLVAAVAGFLTLVIAHNLAIGGDTMIMMQAVLDTNFWLATHVVIVTLGYASTFVAGLLAACYILLGVFTPLLRQKTGRNELGTSLARMVYGIACFATLGSFVGTILGGIWADQSWGRFWGWDPKENGALLIVLWNAIILHSRWGGLVRDRGLMNLAVAGNMVTAWSWFGTNMLGIGLHAYGFMDAAFGWLRLFCIIQLGIIGLGSLPLHWWQSFRGTKPPSLPKAATA